MIGLDIYGDNVKDVPVKLQVMVSASLEKQEQTILQVPNIACFSIRRRDHKDKRYVQVPLTLIVSDANGQVNMQLYAAVCQTGTTKKPLTRVYVAHPKYGEFYYDSDSDGSPKRPKIRDG